MHKLTLHNIDGINMIAIDDEMFDWSIDPDEFQKAIIAAKGDSWLQHNFINNIKKCFMDYFSEFIGRPASLKEINEAIKNGWIN